MKYNNDESSKLECILNPSISFKFYYLMHFSLPEPDML
jgi:hypothetical protein